MTNEETIKILEYEKHKLWWDEEDYYGSLAIVAINTAISALENQPKHGHWIHTGRTNVFGGHQHKCSVCDYTLMVSPMCDNENYCCNCGSKMDEEVGE